MSKIKSINFVAVLFMLREEFTVFIARRMLLSEFTSLMMYYLLSDFLTGYTIIT